MSFNKKTFTFLILILYSFASSADVNNCEHIPYGKPSLSTTDFCRTGYALGYDMKMKSAIWVSYRLERDIVGGVDRQNDFREDLQIPKKFRTTVSDYVEPVYDMGHLANSESIDKSELANSETFLISNMVPQRPGHNRSIWKGLENRERKYANKLGLVYVFTGPIYNEHVEYIGDRVPVPSALWKIIYSPSQNKAITFIIPHEKLKTSQLNKFISSIDDLEKLTGLDFFTSFDNAKEERLESFTYKKQWK